MELSDGIVVAGELVCISTVSSVIWVCVIVGRPTFDRMRIASSLMELLFSGKSLSHDFISHVPIIVFMLTTSSDVLVMVEYGRAYCLLCSLLANDIVIDALLQISRIELRHAETGSIKHRTPSGIE